MRETLFRLVLVSALCACAAPARAQTPPPPPSPAKLVSDGIRVVPVRVHVLVARYEGDKRVSSMPYTMLVNASPRGVGQIRIGAEVPVTTGGAPASADGKQAPVPAVSYEHIGTHIDCRVTPTDDGRYLVELTVSEKSVYPDGEGPRVARPHGNPPFRSFRANNAMVLRDGQTAEFATVGDRLTGEIIRIEGTLHLVK